MSLPAILTASAVLERAYLIPDLYDINPNEILTPSFEVDSNADGLADDWALVGTPTSTIEPTIRLHGSQSQKVVTDNATTEGIVQVNITAPAGITEAVAYAWIYREDPGDDIRVYLIDQTAGITRASSGYNAAGWQTVEDVEGNAWSRVIVSSNAIVAGNQHRLQISRWIGNATQITTFYADKTFWQWGTTSSPTNGLCHAFDEPPETIMQSLPCAVRFPEAAPQMHGSRLLGRYNLYDFKIEVHFPRGVLWEAWEDVLPVVEAVQSLYTANLSIGGTCNVSGFREPAFEGPLNVRYGSDRDITIAIIFYMWAKEMLQDITVNL